MMSTDELNITRIYQGTPISIWTFFNAKKEWKVLANFALQCFYIVGSEAGVERLFSQHKHVVDFFLSANCKIKNRWTLIFNFKTIIFLRNYFAYLKIIKQKSKTASPWPRPTVLIVVFNFIFFFLKFASF